MATGVTPRCWLCVALLTGWLTPSRAPSQSASVPILRDCGLRFPHEWLLSTGDAGEPAEARPWRPPLFRMPFGTLNNAGEPGAGGLDAAEADSRFQFSAGSDNPFFDFRRPGDPGGVGFWKVQTFVPVLESTTAELSLGLQAVMPAGLEFDGLAHGPTVLSPTLVWFQDLGGPAVQAFVGQHLPASGADDTLQRGWLYGLAVQQPLPTLSGGDGCLHLVVEALGRQQRAVQSGWELLPGLHWRVHDNCWMSGGVIFPLDGARRDPGLWQLMCRWQY